MSSVAFSISTGSRRVISPWHVGAAANISTVMGAVSTTIVGVARPYFAGGLSAHFGPRNYFLWSIALFTIGSGMRGLATSLPQLILFQVTQGLGAGGRQPGAGVSGASDEAFGAGENPQIGQTKLKVMHGARLSVVECRRSSPLAMAAC